MPLSSSHTIFSSPFQADLAKQLAEREALEKKRLAIEEKMIVGGVNLVRACTDFRLLHVPSLKSLTIHNLFTLTCACSQTRT